MYSNNSSVQLMDLLEFVNNQVFVKAQMEKTPMHPQTNKRLLKIF
jgi:hypothetical protein